LFAAIITTYDVIIRFIFGISSMWALELCQYCLLFATFMGATYTLTQKTYTRVDIIINKLPAKITKILNRISDILVVLAFSYLAYLSFKFTIHCFNKGWRTSTPLRINLAWLIIIIATGCTLLVIQELIEIYKNYKNEVAVNSTFKKEHL